MANLFGGEGGFGFRASGQGQALVSIYGAVDIIDLEHGESSPSTPGTSSRTTLSVRFQMRRAVQGRTIQSMKSGEGWVFDFGVPAACCCSRATPRRSRNGSPRRSRASSRVRGWAVGGGGDLLGGIFRS